MSSNNTLLDGAETTEVFEEETEELNAASVHQLSKGGKSLPTFVAKLYTLAFFFSSFFLLFGPSHPHFSFLLSFFSLPPL